MEPADHQERPQDATLQTEATTIQSWQTLFEKQTQCMMQLIEAVRNTSPKNIVLPEFDPDNPQKDAISWCATAELCIRELGDQCQGAQLIGILNRALKGRASSWFSQLKLTDVTWSQFKDQFLARFDIPETTAAIFMRLQNDRPREGECLADYASRLLSFLMTRWESVSKEDIAVAYVLAHIAKIEPQPILQRFAFTSDIITRRRLRLELMACDHRKRPATVPASNEPRIKSRREDLPCYYCKNLGHFPSLCKSKNIFKKIYREQNAASTPVRNKDIQCSLCKKNGHAALRCYKANVGGKAAQKNQGISPVGMEPSGALQTLPDATLKPLMSAAGSVLLQHIFSVANDVITEWKEEVPEDIHIKDSSSNCGS